MPRSKDDDIETRAVGLARAAGLDWVKRPQKSGQPDTPAAATNAERDDYRQQALEEIDGESPQAYEHDQLAK